MINSPLISIITPVYNMAESFEDSLLSVLDQSYENVEYIVIDGGSSDGTVSLIQKYEKAINYWDSESDQGIYDAMNKGVQAANGEWLYFLGADDILVDCLHRVIRYIKSPRFIYYGDVYLCEKNKTYSGKFNLRKFASKNINHQSIFYPKAVFKKYNYSLQYPVMADYDLNIKCWADPLFRFRYIPLLICLHGEKGKSHDQLDTNFLDEKAELFQLYLGQAISRQMLLHRAKSYFANLLKRLR